MICKRIRAKAEEQDLTGDYQSETIDIDGKKLVTDVSIERIGDAYVVSYSKNGKLLYIGMGLRKGDIFAMAWLASGKAGVSLYQIEKGPTLSGEFTQVGGPGFLGRETLRRVVKLKDAAFWHLLV
jgi:hypothetical protein